VGGRLWPRGAAGQQRLCRASPRCNGLELAVSTAELNALNLMVVVIQQTPFLSIFAAARHPRRHVGSHSPWRMAIPLLAGMQTSHRTGGSGFLVFVADPRTVRLCRTEHCYRRDAAADNPALCQTDCRLIKAMLPIQANNAQLRQPKYAVFRKPLCRSIFRCKRLPIIRAVSYCIFL
jgi:hypothetical protein